MQTRIICNLTVIVKGIIRICFPHIFGEQGFKFREIICQISLCIDGNKLFECILKESVGNVRNSIIVRSIFVLILVLEDLGTAADIDNRHGVTAASVLCHCAHRSGNHCKDSQAQNNS